MERDCYEQLVKWAQDSSPKPLLLRGARQVGKTHLLRAFGDKEFEHLAYFNFEEDPALGDLFSGRISADRLIRNLGVYAGRPIEPGRSLIVLDEIQASDRALNALKYFQEQAPGQAVAAAGSLLGVQMAGPASFPVGKVHVIDLHPMTLFEFLDATGQAELRSLIVETSSIEPLPLPFHQRLIDHLRAYYVVGGMPEAVKAYAQRADIQRVRQIQEDILVGYEADFGKHATASDIPKLNLIWRSVPAQLSRENKKFVFAAVQKSARARSYEGALQWLESAGLVLRSYLVSAPKTPLAAHAKRQMFKVYLLDVGLLGAMTRTPLRLAAHGEAVFEEYRGALAENYVAQQLAAAGAGLYYWTSEATAEVDYLVEHDAKVYPLEAKAGINPRSKSLGAYVQRYEPPFALRSTLLNLRMDGQIVNIPLYAINALSKLVSTAQA